MNWISLLLVILLTQISSFSAFSEVKKGGRFNLNLGNLGEPPSLHPITATDAASRVVLNYVTDTLLTRDSQTYEWKPRLAEKWEISKDAKTFTFKLRSGLQFHDGKPLTAEDVKFSFDAIFEPQYNAARLRPYYENIEKLEVIDPLTVKATVKTPYFLNFDVIAGSLTILPKHIYSDVEKSKKMNREIIGAGPYQLKSFQRGQRIVLKKFDQWYGNSAVESKDQYNFDEITFRFAKEENIYLEMMKKGDFDYHDLTAEQFVKKTEGGPWGKTIQKVKVTNAIGKGYRWVGWNQSNPLFESKDVRIALAHLTNRREMNKKFHFDLSVLATGPTDVFSDYASPQVKPIEFDPKKAGELLAAQGWKDSDKDGVLDKKIKGQKVDFRFSLIHANKDYEKYYTFYKEDLKKAGIDMEIKFLEWNSFLKVLDEGKFEAVALAWTTGIEFDPKQQWHSSSAVKGGSNFIGYKSSKVDKLIDKARKEIDRSKRIPLLREVYEQIAADAPYVFLFNEQFSFYAVHQKIQRPADTFKYEIGSSYWWLKP